LKIINKEETFMENIILNNGVKMPNFGLGTYLVSPKDA